MIGADDPEIGASVADMHERETRRQNSRPPLLSLLILVCAAAFFVSAWFVLVFAIHHLWLLTVYAWNA